MTSATFARPEKFQIGRVFNNSFAVIGRNLVLCVGLAFLFSGLPAIIIRLWSESRMQAILQDLYNLEVTVTVLEQSRALSETVAKAGV